MDIQDKLFALKKKNYKFKYELYKKRFRLLMSTRFRTCFIFALAEFENVFGKDLWGCGLPDEDLTHEQLVSKKKWNQVRKNILDKGNAQLRAMDTEIGLHSFDFIGHKINLEMKNESRKKGN